MKKTDQTRTQTPHDSGQGEENAPNAFLFDGEENLILADLIENLTNGTDTAASNSTTAVDQTLSPDIAQTPATPETAPSTPRYDTGQPFHGSGEDAMLMSSIASSSSGASFARTSSSINSVHESSFLSFQPGATYTTRITSSAYSNIIAQSRFTSDNHDTQHGDSTAISRFVTSITNTAYTDNSATARTLYFIASEESATKGTPSDPALSDGNFWNSWHLTDEYGLNLDDVWTDYTGENVKVAVFDSGFNYTHAELVSNFNTTDDIDVLDDDTDSTNSNDSTHGTHVSLMIAADDNNSRSVGVAFDSEIIGMRRGFGSDSSSQDTLDGFEHVLTSNADIMNNSWGTTAAFGDHKGVNFVGDVDPSDVHTEIENIVTNGRDGLGANIVFSAGNSQEDGLGANLKNYQNSPYVTTVGAHSSDGTIASFSEWGSNVLLSAPGDDVILPYALGEDYKVTIDGTSFSAPAVSGVISLMLEANDALGYRDVQEILAMSSRQTDTDNPEWQENGASNWNGGGMTFHHGLGYGIADAHAAVRLAETWDLQQTQSNLTETSATWNYTDASIPSSGTVSSSIDISTDIEIEHVLVYMDISHAKAGDLVVSLVSPDGTESVLVDRIENGDFTTMLGVYSGFFFDFSSVAHMGEMSAGTWTLEIEDAASGNAGTLNEWSIAFTGNSAASDDTYYYTEDFSLFSGNLGNRATLTDSDGGTDTINAAAITTGSTVDLAAGTATLDGEDITVSGIENVYTGDGDDTITGSASDNYIWGGRGSDVIDGGDGDDTAAFIDAIDDYTITFDGATTYAALGETVTNVLTNIETFIFDGVSYTYQTIRGLFGAGNAAPSVSADNVTINTGNTILASTVITASDVDGDTLTYTLWDNSPNTSSGHFELDGELVANETVLTQDEFDALDIVAGTDAGTDTLWVKISDGEDQTSWQSFTMTTNVAADLTLTDTTIEAGDYVLASLYIDAVDDNGDTLSYTINDGNSDAGSAYFYLDGETLAAGEDITLTEDEFFNLRIYGGSDTGTDTMTVNVSDGSLSAGADTFTITSIAANVAPTVNLTDLSMNPGDPSVLASSYISPSDSDGDDMTYILWDGSLAPNSGYFELDGETVANETEITQDEFDRLRIVAGSDTGTEELWIRVSDGAAYTSWDSLTLITNTAPSLSVSHAVLVTNDSVLASDYIDANDIDGDTLTYTVNDGNASGTSGHFELDEEALDADQDIELTAAEFSRLRIVGGSGTGTDSLSITVSDGSLDSDTENLTLTTIAENNAPTVTVRNVIMDYDATISASHAVIANDTDGDTLTYTTWDNSQGTTTAFYSLDSSYLSNETEITQDQFDTLQIEAGTNATTETLWARVHDGEDHSAWVQYSVETTNVSTLTGSDDHELLAGGDDANTLNGGAGEDVLYGGDGLDQLTGGDDADIFVFQDGSAFNDQDTITDFNTADGDAIDISDILTGFYDPETDAITDFLQITDNGSDSTVSVDQDGGGNSFAAIATIEGVTGLTDEQTLHDNGNIIL